MFRELTRKNKKLSHEECIEILKNTRRGVLSVIGDGDYPYGTPMNHYYNEQEGKLYFHCGQGGHRLDAILQNPKGSFCAYDEGEQEEGHWALRFKSVIVFGKVTVITDPDRIIDITTKLSRKFTSDESYIQSEIKAHAHRTLLLELTPEHISGKAVTES